MELITEARITAMPRPMPEGMFDEIPNVMIRVNGGSERVLFSYFPDEISFTADEFVGLSISDAKELKLKKDNSYLKS